MRVASTRVVGYISNFQDCVRQVLEQLFQRIDHSAHLEKEISQRH